MLESLRKKREAELQVRLLENRIRRLKEEEHQIKSKEAAQKRQIEHIIRVRRHAQMEKEAQQRRKEEMMLEMEERKAKIARDKRVTRVGKARSVRRYRGEVMQLGSELRNESRLRSAQIHQIKEREVREN